MTVFLTSSPSGPLDNSRYVDGLDDKNRFVEELRCRWPEYASCLYITAEPEGFSHNDWICQSMAGTFRHRGLSIAAFDVWDDRSGEVSAEMLNEYQVLILGGGHVPTQNRFFQRIALREKIASFKGLVIGISAGTMNSADIVYAQPELEGESYDPSYERFLTGLALTSINILPHYQMVKDFYLDGRRLFEDITYSDSYGHEFLALTDGSYVLLEQGSTRLCGEAYRISNGEIEKICEENQIIEL